MATANHTHLFRMEQRQHRLHVLISSDEKQRLERDAAARGWTLSQLVRDRALNPGVAQPEPPQHNYGLTAGEVAAMRRAFLSQTTSPPPAGSPVVREEPAGPRELWERDSAQRGFSEAAGNV